MGVVNGGVKYRRVFPRFVDTTRGRSLRLRPFTRPKISRSTACCVFGGVIVLVQFFAPRAQRVRSSQSMVKTNGEPQSSPTFCYLDSLSRCIVSAIARLINAFVDSPQLSA